MANETAKGSAAVAGSGPQTDSMAAARAARRTRKKSRPMNDKEKFAKRTIQQARSALAKLQVALENGNEVPSAVISACANITAAAGAMLFD